MKKKILACMLALAVVCNSGGVAWAFGGSDEEVEVFDSGNVVWDGTKQKEVEQYEEPGIEDDVEVFEGSGQLVEAETVSKNGAISGDNVTDEDVFGNDIEEDVVAFSDEEPVFGDSAHMLVNTGHAGTLEAGQSIALSGNADGKADFTFKANEDGIYKFNLSEWLDMSFPEGINLGYGNNFRVVKLAAGSYAVQCSEVAERVTVTAEKMIDVERLELVSYNPNIFYKGEIVFDDSNAVVDITKADGTVERASKEESSYGFLEFRHYADTISCYFPWAAGIYGEWTGLSFKDISENDPKKISTDTGEIQVSPNEDGRYYVQFIPESTGIYSISFGLGEEEINGNHISVYEVPKSDDGAGWRPLKDVYTSPNITVELTEGRQYIVRAKVSGLTRNISAKVETAVGVQSFKLASGSKLPTEMVRDFTEISPDTKFEIKYTDGTLDEIGIQDISPNHGWINRKEDGNGNLIFSLNQDLQSDEEGHFVKGPKVIDFGNATGITEIPLEQTESIPLSDIYLDGAYFKFQAPEEGTFKFLIKNAGKISTSWDESYQGDQNVDHEMFVTLSKDDCAYLKASDLSAEMVEVTVSRIPAIKSITLIDGEIDGKTFIRSILESYGLFLIYGDCRFKVEYTDGTPPEIISFFDDGQSRYYGSLHISRIWDDHGNILAGKRKITFGFDGSGVRTPEYTIDIVDLDSEMFSSIKIGEAQTLRKGPQDMQWLRFQAPEAGTYYFNIKASGEDITQDSEYFWARESAKVRGSQELKWNKTWKLDPFVLQKGEVIYIGIAEPQAVVTAKVVNVPNITKIELANGEVLPDAYISEFLEAEGYGSLKFKIIFSDNKSIVAAVWDIIQRDGISYGELNCERPINDDGDYASGKIKVYVGDTYIEEMSYFKDVTVKKAADITDLPQLKQNTPISSTSSVNYNNAYCFVYEAEQQGIYEISFTPKDNDADNWNRFWLLKDGRVSDSGAWGGTSFVREMKANEKIYFMYKGQDCSVDVKPTGTTIKSFSVTPKYQDILYGHFCEFNKWEFQLTLSDESKSETQYSGYSSFDRYGRIDYTLDNGRNFEDGAGIGETNVQFYLRDFPDIKSEKIPISVKKGSEMNFTKLELDKEVKVEETSTYANYHSATFIPEEDGLYEYKVKSWFNVELIDDDGINPWIDSTDNIYEGVIEGRANKGYTFLVEWPDGAEIGESTILITKIDKTNLQTLYNANKDKSSSGYTTYSWNAFAHALEEAEAVLENESALQREIDKAYENLETAIKGLTYIYYPPSVDKSSLRQLYNTCSGYKEADYTAQSWKAFQEAMTTAKSALDNSYSQSTVDDAEKKLKAAADGLVKAADKKSLQEAFDKYKAYDKADYTETTWAPFEKALSDAEKGLADKDLTTEKASELLTALEKAAAGLKKVGVPVLKTVNVSGNKATVQLSGKAEKAQGYDFVIGTDKNCIRTKKYDGARKNITTLKTDFKYVQKGTYYAYCHAWKKVDGKKVFGGWSQPFKFTVTATTPVTPKIKSISVKGSTVTVVFEKIKNVTSYDVVLGKKTANDSIYGKRPVDYGKLVKKSKGNAIVFKNVKKGTYYLGAHAANRTGKGGKKIFSKWSGAKKLVVK